MKFLKGQNTSRYIPNDNSLEINPYGRAVMDFNGAVMVPKGTTAERPTFVSGMRQPAEGETLSTKIPNGYLRFNVDIDSFEGYINGTWEVIRAPGANTITKQTLGPGDYAEDTFGPLLTDAIYQNAYTASDDNIMVFVENVYQISTTNYTVVQNPAGKAAGYYIQFTSPVPLDKYITVLYGFAN
jgi:hypothetical protein